MATLIGFFLQREGYKLHRAADGRQARAMIDEIMPPRLVLLEAAHDRGVRLRAAGRARLRVVRSAARITW